MNTGISLSWLGVWLARILGSNLSGSGEKWMGASASGSASTDLHYRFRREARRIRIVSHNASDKLILSRLFQIWRHFQVAPV